MSFFLLYLVYHFKKIESIFPIYNFKTIKQYKNKNKLYFIYTKTIVIK